MKNEKQILLVAEAIADQMAGAGQQYGIIEPQSASKRARNLIENGYVRASSEGAGWQVEILMEQNSHEDWDCPAPLEPFGPLEESTYRLNERLAHHGIEIQMHNTTFLIGGAA